MAETLNGYIQFRDPDSWGWIGTVIEIGEVTDGTIVNVSNFVPNGYLISNENMNPSYTVTEGDIEWAIQNPDDSAGYGVPAGGWVLNVGLDRYSIDTIVNLDIARHFYSVEVIKEFVDVLSEYPNTSLQLHMFDNENVAVECAFIDQTVENATLENGVYTNPVSGKSFLSKENLTEIVEYASSRNVLVIPEIEVPGHMEMFLRLLKESSNQNMYTEVTQAAGNLYASKTMDYSKSSSVVLTQQVIDEYLPIFREQDKKIFSIGGDEVGVIATQGDIHPKENADFIHFCNVVQQYLEDNGFIMRMYNDYIPKTEVASLSKEIQVVYWSKSGGLGLENTDEYTESGQENNASPEDFLNQSFSLVNANGYYLYMNASEKAFEEENMEYSIRDMNENFKVVNFILNSKEATWTSNQIFASMISIWGSAAQNYTDQEIFEHVKDFTESFLKLMNPS